MNFANFGLLIHGVFVINLAISTRSQVCNVTDTSRLYCGWQGINETICTTRNGCCWKSSTTGGSIPWCFYDSNISAILKSESVCEHAGPARLVCNNNQRVDIHDAFYGRNNDNKTCHNSGTITCFNPNATEIVRRICKMNSTCTVSPKGSIWNFDSSCDMLNAQLKIHYFCVAKGQISSTQIHASSTPHHASPTKNHLSTSLYSPTLVKPTVRQSPEGSTMQTAKTTARDSRSSKIHSLHLELKKKDHVIIGLTVAVSIMGCVIITFLFLFFRNDRGKDTDQLSGSKTAEHEMGTTNCYDVMDLTTENPYYDST
ncbi:uncharacterized protein LOC135689979 isoform X2 [Rhopilema esculentum]|uniref:uncharacterized protein LOC135689979 isoform X2 n=1 Tax=Rhopilema esculentum TaxID=499914 RepID=UPI0031E02D28